MAAWCCVNNHRWLRPAFPATRAVCIVHNPAVTFWPPKRWTAHPKNEIVGVPDGGGNIPKDQRHPYSSMRSSLGTLDAKVSSVPGPKFCQYLSYSRSQKSNASETPPGFSVHEVSRQDLVFWAPPLLMFKKPDGPGLVSLDVSSLLPGSRRCHGNPQGWAHQPWSHTWRTDRLWKLTLSPIFTHLSWGRPILQTSAIREYSGIFQTVTIPNS